MRDEEGLNLKAMARFVASFDGEGMETRLAMFSDDAQIDDWYAPGRTIVGAPELERTLQDTGPTEGLEDYRFVLLETIVAGNVLVILGEATGVFSRDLVHEGRPSIPAHGRPVRWVCRDIYHFERGKVVRALYGADTLGLARQLGIASENGWLQ